MIKYIPIFLLLLLLLTGCKTASFLNNSTSKTTKKLTLGGIGSDDGPILQRQYNSVAIPAYEDPIKLSVISKIFDKQRYKEFTKARDLQLGDVKIEYIDSLEIKPKYLQLDIADKVSIIKSLNQTINQEVKDYLDHNRFANLLTGITMAFNERDLEKILGANAVFLVQDRPKQYVLQLVGKKGESETMAFNEGIVFGYSTSHFCWQENKRHQVDIVDLVGSFEDCPNSTYRNAERAKKNVNYYKL